jgi:serine/threonine protein kinase
MSVFTSSDQSYVIIDPNDETIATQFFRHPEEYARVKKVAFEICQSDPVNILFPDGARHSFLPTDVLSTLRSFDDTHSKIRWSRLRCLNQLEPSEAFSCVRRHWIQFFWNVFKGILAMHICGYHHGDVSLDNIGLSEDGRFVLYDFNLSRKSLHFSDDIEHDHYRLWKSVRFHTSQHSSSLTPEEKHLLFRFEQAFSIQEWVSIVRDIKEFETYAETIRYLEELRVNNELKTSL